MTGPDEYFRPASSWDEAAGELRFTPVVPADTAGHHLVSLSVHVRDARRELPIDDRSLEAHYDGFVLTQAWKGTDEARRWATEVGYGPDPQPAQVAGRPGMAYELGPRPDPDDIDPRMPAVVAWHDDEMFYLIASDTLEAPTLVQVALSMYPEARPP